MGVPRDSLSHNHCVERLPLCLALVGQSLSDFIATIKGLCWFRLLGSTWHYKAARGTLFRNFPQDHKVASSEITAVSQALWWETDLSPILLHYITLCLPLVVRAHSISRAAKSDLCFAVALISRYSPPCHPALPPWEPRQQGHVCGVCPGIPSPQALSLTKRCQAVSHCKGHGNVCRISDLRLPFLGEQQFQNQALDSARLLTSCRSAVHRTRLCIGWLAEEIGTF